MSVASRSVFVLVCGLVSQIGESNPLSNTGCACTSGCDKSVSLSLTSKSSQEWCYVAPTCNTIGWDWCYDTQMLFRSAVDGKKRAEVKELEEHVKRNDAEKRGESLRVQLQGAKTQLEALSRQLTDARLKSTAQNVMKLEKQLEAEHSKEESLQKQLDASQKTASNADLKRKYAETKVDEMTKETKKENDEFQKKLEQANTMRLQTEQLRLEAFRKAEEADKKRKDVESKAWEAQEQLSSKLGKMEQRALGAEKKLHDEEEMLEYAKQKQIQTDASLKDVTLQKRDVDKQLKDLGAKHAGTVNALREETSHKKTAEVKAVVAETKMVDAEKRRDAAEVRTFRLAVRGAVRGGNGVVETDGTVKRWKIR